MIPRTQVILLFFFSMTVAFASGQRGWYAYKDTNGVFELEFPDTPSMLTENIETPFGYFDTEVLYHQGSITDDNLFLGMAHVNLTSDSLSLSDSSTFNEVIDYTYGLILENLNGEMLDEKSIIIDDIKMKEFHLDIENGYAIATIRVYLIKNNLYTVQALTSRALFQNKSLNHFLDSFHILKE